MVLDDQVYSVIGVMPPAFRFPSNDVELWVPLVFSPADYEDRNNNELYGVARLKPGATIASARSEMSLLAAQSRKQFPKENENTDATVNGLRDDLTRQSRVMVLALSGAALCVLLIVCANLANLLLARALGRRQELAVRTALGAGRERLIRQLATESVVLAALGGALGVLLAVLLVPMLWRLVPSALPTVRHAGHRSAGPRVRRSAHAWSRRSRSGSRRCCGPPWTSAPRACAKGAAPSAARERETARRARRSPRSSRRWCCSSPRDCCCARCGPFRAAIRVSAPKGVLTLRTESCPRSTRSPRGARNSTTACSTRSARCRA